MIRQVGSATSFESFALAFETSGAVGSIALGRGDAILETQVFGEPRAHAVEFFPAIDQLCCRHGVSPAQVSRVFVSAGPGSFTGLRIGITAARSISLATGAKIVPIPTLEVIAQNAAEIDTPPDVVAVVLDAKRKHVYAGVFRRGSTHEHGEGPQVHYSPIIQPAEVEPEVFLRAQDLQCAVMGEGVLYHRDAIERSGRAVLPEEVYRPRAEIVYRLGAVRAAVGQFTDRRDSIPVYIRPPEAEEKWMEKQQVERRK